MAVVFTPPNRLAGILGGAEDPTLEDLAATADRRVEALGPELRARVRALAEDLGRVVDQDETEIFAECRRLSAAALSICEVAGAADLEALGEAARGLHALIEALFSQGVWHTEALRLHVGSLTILNADPPPQPEAARQMLARLKGMRDWLGVAE